MTEQTQPVAFQGPGQAPEIPSPQPVEGEQGKATPEYVTKEEAQRLAKEAAAEALRQAQSLFDKGNDRTMKKVQADLQNLSKSLDLQRKAGIEVSPEQEETLRQRVISQVLSAPDQPESPPATQAAQAQAPAKPAEELDPINAEARKMEAAAGVVVAEDDPEFKTIIVNRSGYEFLKSVEAAIAAKKERLGMPPENAIPNLGGGTNNADPNPIKNITNPDKLIKMGYEQRKRR